MTELIAVKLYLENGNYSGDEAIDNPDEKFIRRELKDEYFDFAILAQDDRRLTYIQFAIIEDTDRYNLEYQDGSVSRHYETEKPVSLSRAISAFIWYLRGDPSWKSEFVWERIAI